MMMNLTRMLCAVTVLALALPMAGCDEDTILKPEELNPPLGLWSVTGNGEVDLVWFTSNFEGDLDGYAIYVYEGDYGIYTSRSSIPSGFERAATLPVSTSSSGTQGITITGLDNGQTYSFLVTAAKDDWEKNSHTSNIIIDTPRHEVWALQLQNENKGAGTPCALKFSSSPPYVEVVDKTDPDAMIMFESFDAGLGKRSGFVGVQQRAQIQDLGFMADWSLADVAPESGYPDADFSVTAMMHHVYAVRMGFVTPNYAKIYVQSITGNPVDNSDVATVRVAYQTDPANPEYMPAGE
jgi:hypothetical protein